MNSTELRDTPDDTEHGVYTRGPDGLSVRIHLYQGGNYILEDITALFELGENIAAEDGLPSIRLTNEEVRRLKAMADAYSFDYEDGLIELCLDIHRFAQASPAERYQFSADF